MTEGVVATALTPARADQSSSFESWLLQKLRLEWSSCEFGGLLTPSKLVEARACFPHLETPIKIRLLLSLLSVRRNEEDGAGGTMQTEAAKLFSLAEQDAEEWVKVSAGIVKQFMASQADGQLDNSYLKAQLEATASKVVEAVTARSQTRRSNVSAPLVALDDLFSLENGLLNPSLRPPLVPTAAMHFTVSGEDDDANGKEDEMEASPAKKPLHRPQMARPAGVTVSAAAATLPSASTRTPVSSKPPVGKKKNLTELSSKIRRKADAGRFKRQRSRISMIDINEVKQIESEKAQKAEERKKQKLAAKEKEKEKAKEKEKEKNDAAAMGAATDLDGKGGGADAMSIPASVSDEHAIAADIFAMHQQPGLDDSMQQYSQQQLQTEDHMEHNEVTSVGGDENDYVPDGTQALLNAAFHSTQDILKEVVSQQNQQMQEQHQMHHQHMQQPAYQELYRTQQQMQMHHLAPPQQQYHQGFEPEDATLTNTSTGGIPMGFGAYNYGATAGYYGDQFGNYGAPQDTNAFGSAGYANSAMIQPDNGMNGMGLPPLGGRQMGYDPTLQHQQHQQQNNGGYMGGSGDYWR